MRALFIVSCCTAFLPIAGHAQIISGGRGTVTSVGINPPSIMTATQPVTSNGSITLSLNPQSSGTVLAAPIGSSGVPTFRSLAPADIPTLNQNTTGSAARLSGYSIGTAGAAVPLLNGNNTFSGTAAFSNSFQISGSGTPFYFYNGSAGIDAKLFRTYSQGAGTTSSLTFDIVNDAYTAAAIWGSVSRTGMSINNVNFYAPTNITGATTITGTTYVSGKTTIGATGWLEVAVPNTETLAQTQSISTGGKIGTLGACRTSDLPLAGAAACLGADGIAINNNLSFIQGAYGHYAEARRYGNAGWTYGMENNVLNGGDTQDETPYTYNQAGITESYRATCGRSDTTLNNPCSVALIMTQNGGQFRRGILITGGALDPSGSLEAVTMASGYNVAWYTPQNAVASRIYGGSGTASTVGQLSLVAANSDGVPVTVSLMGYGNNSFAPSSSAIDIGSLSNPWNRLWAAIVNKAPSTPASSSAPCAIGDEVADANYFYRCTSANTWKRAALSAF